MFERDSDRGAWGGDFGWVLSVPAKFTEAQRHKLSHTLGVLYAR